MLEVTPAKLKRLYKAMSDIACRETSYNPFKGAIWYYNGWLYATDSFCIVRVELSWLKYEGRWGKLYVVQGTDDKGFIDLGEDATTDRYNDSGNAKRLAEMFEPDMKAPDGRVGTDLKILNPALKCFNALKLPVTFSQDSKRLFLTAMADAKFERYNHQVRMEALVMHVRLP